MKHAHTQPRYGSTAATSPPPTLAVLKGVPMDDEEAAGRAAQGEGTPLAHSVVGGGGSRSHLHGLPLPAAASFSAAGDGGHGHNHGHGHSHGGGKCGGSSEAAGEAPTDATTGAAPSHAAATTTFPSDPAGAAATAVVLWPSSTTIAQSVTAEVQLKQRRSLQQLASVYMIEFGITVHSVFIGIAAGVIGTDDLKGLVVALVFHQFFEGVALGSRLADVEIVSLAQEYALITTFTVAAPVGLALGMGMSAAMNTAGPTFLLVQGTFDGVCAGLLLFLGFSLLLRDFEDDLKRFCGGKPHEGAMRAGMFAALWIGAGTMAFIGRWL